MENIKNIINYIFEQKLGIDKQKLVPTATFADLELDEIDLVMLTISLEDELEIMLEDEKMAKINNLQELYSFVNSHVNKTKELQP